MFLGRRGNFPSNVSLRYVPERQEIRCVHFEMTEEKKISFLTLPSNQANNGKD